jgi:hypothetical protein
MTANFPPQVAYPTGIDSDRTLYLVYNTTESLLAADNEPWSSEIQIIPVGADDPEIWADNGFGNIGGELFYYDAVEKNADGKVFKLKKCLRNLGGERTQYNSIVGGSVLCPTTTNTVVRSYVVAEHHNQLLEAIYQLQEFIGRNFDPDVETLDFRIRCLQEVPICPDECSVITQFSVVETEIENPPGCVGIEIAYSVDIEGEFTNYRLEFGDGSFTTTNLQGTHIYSPNSNIDPVVILEDPNCTTVQTPVQRRRVESVPALIGEEPFFIPLPEIPEIPEVVVPDVEVRSCGSRR